MARSVICSAIQFSQAFGRIGSLGSRFKSVQQKRKKKPKKLSDAFVPMEDQRSGSEDRHTDLYLRDPLPLSADAVPLGGGGGVLLCKRRSFPSESTPSLPPPLLVEVTLRLRLREGPARAPRPRALPSSPPSFSSPLYSIPYRLPSACLASLASRLWRRFDVTF